MMLGNPRLAIKSGSDRLEGCRVRSAQVSLDKFLDAQALKDSWEEIKDHGHCVQTMAGERLGRCRLKLKIYTTFFSDPAPHGVQHDHRSDHTIEARRETQGRAFKREHPR